MKKVTIWSKINRAENGKILSIKFNHIEDGWIESDYPKPLSDKFINQKAWSKNEWHCKYGIMDREYRVTTI